jgi:hypothetical protein
MAVNLPHQTRQHGDNDIKSFSLYSSFFYGLFDRRCVFHPKEEEKKKSNKGEKKHR